MDLTGASAVTHSDGTPSQGHRCHAWGALSKFQALFIQSVAFLLDIPKRAPIESFYEKGDNPTLRQARIASLHSHPFQNRSALREARETPHSETCDRQPIRKNRATFLRISSFAFRNRARAGNRAGLGRSAVAVRETFRQAGGSQAAWGRV